MAVCTVITLYRPGQDWPLLLAANRDEMIGRPWDPPAQHWRDRPRITGGRDGLGGGTWMAVREDGLVAAILNRPGSLGPAPGKRSRGDLPLRALDAATAAAAAAVMTGIDGSDYRSFNLIIADRDGVWFVRGTGAATVLAERLTDGLHMVTAHDPDDAASPRVARHFPRFAAAAAPVPPDWAAWRTLLADDAGPRDAALSVPPSDVPGAGSFGTVSASLLGLSDDGRCTWLFAPGQAGQAPFSPVAMPPPALPRAGGG